MTDTENSTISGLNEEDCIPKTMGVGSGGRRATALPGFSYILQI